MSDRGREGASCRSGGPASASPGIGALVASFAERLLRLPLTLAGVCLVALLADVSGRGLADDVARLALPALVCSYLAAGLLTAPRFPRGLRGPATRSALDGRLLDLWTAIAALVVVAAITAGTFDGLL